MHINIDLTNKGKNCLKWLANWRNPQSMQHTYCHTSCESSGECKRLSKYPV